MHALTAGNHDCLGAASAQVAFANVSAREHRRPRWHMPRRYYTYTSGLVEAVVLDTCALFCAFEPNLAANDHCHLDPEQRDRGALLAAAQEQMEWFQAALDERQAPCRVVVGHVPVYSAVLCKAVP